MIQLQCINRILNDKSDSFITVNNLNNSFFSDYTQEFNFIINHLNTYGNIPDKTSFLTKFPNFDIIEVKETDQYLISELYKDKNKRALAKTFNEIRELLSKGDVDNAMKLFSNASERVSQNIRINTIDIITDKSRYDNYVERCENINSAYVTTGFPEIDNLIGGWDRSEEYVTIVARPGIGKTWLALKIASAAALRGLNVGIYSGEMSVNKVAYRIDSLIGHISNKMITHGDIGVQNSYKKYLDTLGDKVKGHIHILTPSMIGGPAGVTELKGFIEREHLDMLCVDQHSLLSDDRHGKSAQERAANISGDIKNLQVMTQIPIITVSQQNRESTDNGLDTRLISNADKIGQDSTIVIFVEQKDSVMTLTLAKVRDAETGKKFQYAIDLDKGIFRYLPDDSDANNMQACEALKKEFDDEQINGDDVF